MTYYNAIVYTDYQKNITYHNVTNPDKLIEYLKKNISYTKVFLYRKTSRKEKNGVYCAYHYPNFTGFAFK